MLEIRLGPADLVRIRFARSPLQELVGSLHVLVDPRRQAMHRPWFTAIGSRLRGVRLELLPELVAERNYVVDFLTPPPARADVTFEEEVDRVRASTVDEVRGQLDEMAKEKPPTKAVRALYEHPARHLPRLADELMAYWHAAIEPVWPRLRALTDADVGYRASELTAGGVAQLFAHLHPRLTRDGDRLLVHTPNWDETLSLRGDGLLLVPCVFAWPTIAASLCVPSQQMLTYTPRGVATVWTDQPSTEEKPLGQLVGRSRAALLARLDLPQSTTQLASSFGLTLATVSEHLSVLRRCGLVTSRRAGRTVLYQRTNLATHLLDAQH